MLESEKNFYLSTKKCRRALFDIALLQRKPPLHLFQQSPISRDKVICDLTGAVLNKQEEALWKHMMGKKFQHKLGELFFMLILFFFSPLVCSAAAES
jgi:hypothetical protein